MVVTSGRRGASQIANQIQQNMKLFLIAALIVSAATAGYGQCDKKTVLTASKTDHLAGDSSVERSVDGAVTVEFDKTNFTVHPPNEGALTGKIDSFACNWPTPYKAGRTWIKVTLTNEQGESEHVTVIIEGKGGKVILYATGDDEPDKTIRLTADKFEEKN